MELKERTNISRNSIPFLSLPLTLASIFISLFLNLFNSDSRQYYPGNITKNDTDRNRIKAMEQFFFNARKNINTNPLDYQSMLAADMADRAMKNLHRANGVATVPNFDWISMGPSNTGGCTRAILIDNNDPTHQTIFAGAITGGIWKSTNGGATWGNTIPTIAFSQEDTMQNMNICCLAQDSKGTIYAGTGDGFTAGGEPEFSSGEIGGGIFKSTDDGKTWRLLSSTIPIANNNTVRWAYVNRIAIRPDSFQVIYAATNQGLMVSHDSGAHWNSAVNSATHGNLNGNTLDVKISVDGSVVVAFVNGYGYYCYPQSGNSNVFTKINTTGAGYLPGNDLRIEFGISPIDANRIYASVAGVNGAYTISNVFMTMTGKTNGGYWYNLGVGLSGNQGTYDNTVGVPPANEAQVLIGGTIYWEWSGNSLTDTVGSWNKVSHQNAYYSGDPLWIHEDDHATIFDPNNPETVYIGTDGGIFKCANYSIDPTNAINTINRLLIQPINQNYDVTQFYSVCYSPRVNYANTYYGNSTMIQGLGIGGGTQNQGSPYINGVNFTITRNEAATDMSGGDGGGCAVSQINPNIAYFCSDFGYLLREGNLNNLSAATSAYTQTRGYNIGGNIDSVYEMGGSCFVFPVALYENYYDTLNHDSVLFVAGQNYNAGDTIYPQGINGTYPYIVPYPFPSGAKIKVPDRVVSRLAVGFVPNKGGIWINGQGASNNPPIWIPIGGPLSTPVALTDAAPVHALAWSGDGNTLYIGTEDGSLYTLTNINSVIANSYRSGALWSNGGSMGIVDTSNSVVSADLTTALNVGAGRDILSISVDQNNPNKVLVTVGNYGETTYVYYSGNALSPTPTFTSVQGNLPKMPVYSSILDIMDSTAHWVTNSAMIGTEHGIYTTSDITRGNSTVWVKNNSGMANVMTLALKQQTTPAWMCNNFGVIYAGTLGRGIWSTNNFHNIVTATPAIVNNKAPNEFLVYPNPMTNEGNIRFSIASADNITITIYDMQGRVIKTLNLGNETSGSHIVRFDSSDLKQGTYFASLTGINFRKVSKFVVVK